MVHSSICDYWIAHWGKCTLKTTFNSRETKTRIFTEVYKKMILYNLGLIYGFIFIDYTQESFLHSANF